MNDTLLGVIVAGGFSILTVLVNRLFNLWDQRMETKKKSAEIELQFYTEKRIAATEEYYDALYSFDTVECSDEVLRRVLQAHAKLSAYVSPDALELMVLMLKKFEISVAQDHQHHKSFDTHGMTINLTRQLNKELNFFNPPKNYNRHN